MATEMDAECDKTRQNVRFGQLTTEECVSKGDSVQNRNTINNELKSSKIFKAYLSQLGVENTDFFSYTEQELDEYLSTFWWNARTQKGNEYTASSMETIRYSLNRALQRFRHNFDITSKKGVSFLNSIKSFENAQKDRKQRGLGRVKNTQEITASGDFLHILSLFKNTKQGKNPM